MCVCVMRSYAGEDCVGNVDGEGLKSKGKLDGHGREHVEELHIIIMH